MKEEFMGRGEVLMMRRDLCLSDGGGRICSLAL